MKNTIKQQNKELEETKQIKRKKEKEMKNKLTENEMNYIEELFGYVFKKKEFLVQAFTRKSFGIKYNVPYNEVFKKIGDSLINTLMMKEISKTGFKMKNGKVYNIIEDYSEVAKIVKMMNYNSVELFIEEELKLSCMNNSNLSLVIKKNNLQELMIIDEADRKNNVIDNTNIMSDLFKSIIGAIACDSNWNIDMIEAILNELLDTQSSRQILNRTMDYVTSFNQWYYLNSGEFPNFVYDYNNNLHTCKFNLFDLDINKEFVGEGSTKKFARRDCCEKIINYLNSIEALNDNNKIALYLSKLTKENADVMMNNLYKKGLIPEPKYSYTSSIESNGEIVWVCDSNLGFKDLNTNVQYHFPSHKDHTKTEAKKFLCFIILGTISSFLDEGLNVEIIEY